MQTSVALTASVTDFASTNKSIGGSKEPGPLTTSSLAVLIAADPHHGEKLLKQSATAVNKEEFVHLIDWLVRRLSDA